MNHNDDYKICIDANNLYVDEYKTHYKKSKFNCPLLNSLDNLLQLEVLSFGFSFNQPLNNSLDN